MIDNSNSLKINEYLSGENLFGDNFDLNEIKKWYIDEIDGYAEICEKRNEYTYDALNYYYGFRYLPDRAYKNVLGIGSAYGDEFKPIAKKIKDLIILEPSETFITEDCMGIHSSYIKPNIDGTLPFNNNQFDLITCLGVLHHIANVSFVVQEIYRCLEPGGFALIREPIVSLGDWTQQRVGVTKRERGIPLKIMQRIIKENKFGIISEKLCMFPLISIFYKIFNVKIPFYKFNELMYLDDLLSRIFRNNYVYHAISIYQHLSPSSVFYVLQK